MQATWHYDERDEVYFVRLTDDGAMAPLCTTESKCEAMLITQVFNAVIATDAHLCMMASRATHDFLHPMLGNPNDIPTDIHA